MKREVEVVRLIDKTPDDLQNYRSDYPYYYSPSSDARLNIVSAILEFYLIEELLLNFPDDFFLMERKRMSNIFISLLLFRKDLTEKLSRALFDYLCVSSFGEARHSKGKSVGAYILTDSLPKHSQERYNIYHNAYHYSPAKFLPKIYKVFLFGGWTSGFGGEKWANIVKSAMLYEKVPHQVFIDHVIDLAHNGGTAFDKDCVLRLQDSGTLRSILNSKFQQGGLKKLIENGGITSAVNITPQLKEIAVEIGARSFGEYFIKGLVRIKSKELEFPIPVQWKDKDIAIFLEETIINNTKEWKKSRETERLKLTLKEVKNPLIEIYKKFVEIKGIYDILFQYQSGNFCSKASEKCNEYKTLKKEERRLKRLEKKEYELTHPKVESAIESILGNTSIKINEEVMKQILNKPQEQLTILSEDPAEKDGMPEYIIENIEKKMINEIKVKTIKQGENNARLP